MSTDPIQADITQARGIATQYQIPLVDALQLIRHRELTDSLKRIHDAIDEVAASEADIHRALEKLSGKFF